MSLTKKAPKYTLLDSGYLERLINAFRLVKYDIDFGKEQITLALRTNDIYESDEDEFNITVNDPKPIFLYTSHEKKSIYCPHDLDIDKYQSDILKVFGFKRSEGSICGLIMFENEGNTTYDKVKLLQQQQHYCACFGVMGMNTYFVDDEFFAVEYKIDGESG